MGGGECSLEDALEHVHPEVLIPLPAHPAGSHSSPSWWGAPAAPLPSRLVCAMDAPGWGAPPPCLPRISSPGRPSNPGLHAQPPPACGTNYVLIPEVSET